MGKTQSCVNKQHHQNWQSKTCSRSTTALLNPRLQAWSWTRPSLTSWCEPPTHRLKTALRSRGSTSSAWTRSQKKSRSVSRNGPSTRRSKNRKINARTTSQSRSPWANGAKSFLTHVRVKNLPRSWKCTSKNTTPAANQIACPLQTFAEERNNRKGC